MAFSRPSGFLVFLSFPHWKNSHHFVLHQTCLPALFQQNLDLHRFSGLFDLTDHLALHFLFVDLLILRLVIRRLFPLPVLLFPPASFSLFLSSL